MNAVSYIFRARSAASDENSRSARFSGFELWVQNLHEPVLASVHEFKVSGTAHTNCQHHEVKTLLHDPAEERVFIPQNHLTIFRQNCRFCSHKPHTLAHGFPVVLLVTPASSPQICVKYGRIDSVPSPQDHGVLGACHTADDRTVRIC